MRKIIQTGVLFIALILGGKAYSQGLNFGIKAGVNLSTFTGSDLLDKKNKLGYQVGIAADYGFGNNLHLLAELQLITKGAKYKYEVSPLLPITTEINANAFYLQLPVHLGYKFEINQEMGILLQAGPYVAYGIGGKVKSGDTKTDFFGDGTNRFDFGAGGSVGVEYGRLGIYLGYDWGFLNVIDSDFVTAKNGNAHLTVGYKF